MGQTTRTVPVHVVRIAHNVYRASINYKPAKGGFVVGTGGSKASAVSAAEAMLRAAGYTGAMPRWEIRLLSEAKPRVEWSAFGEAAPPPQATAGAKPPATKTPAKAGEKGAAKAAPSYTPQNAADKAAFRRAYAFASAKSAEAKASGGDPKVAYKVALCAGLRAQGATPHTRFEGEVSLEAVTALEGAALEFVTRPAVKAA